MPSEESDTGDSQSEHGPLQEETDDWVRGFLAGVAFCETNVYDKPLEMQGRAREYREDVPLLLHDVWIPAGLGYDQGWITPMEYERERYE